MKTPILTLSMLDREAQDGLERLAAGLGDKRPLLRAMGEEGKKAAQARILAGGPAPSGEPWQGLTPLTLRLKKGKGILRETGMLHGSITWQEAGPDAVAIGSRMIYARIHQLGGIIRPKNGLALVLPDGSRRRSVRMPARPYLGFNAQEVERLKKKALAWLRRLAKR